MKPSALVLFALLGPLVLMGGLPAHASPAGQERLDAARLKAMVDGFGFEVKPLSTESGKEKWEVAMKTERFNVPIAFEISPSQNYVWLTVSLGEAPKPETEGAAAKFDKILRANHTVQPTQFYISSRGFLQLGLALENRDLTPALLRKGFDKVVADVEKTSDVWGG